MKQRVNRCFSVSRSEIERYYARKWQMPIINSKFSSDCIELNVGSYYVAIDKTDVRKMLRYLAQVSVNNNRINQIKITTQGVIAIVSWVE